MELMLLFNVVKFPPPTIEIELTISRDKLKDHTAMMFDSK
jgi:hypothetical protein